MKAVRATVLSGVLACAYGLANAWFFFLPLGLIQTAVEGGTCLPATASPGDKIPHYGREYLVTATNGTSSRCTDPRWPVIGKIELVLTDAELRAEQTACLPQGARVGMKTTIPGTGEVVIRSIDRESCSDVRNPVSARVVRAGYAAPAPAPAPAPAQETEASRIPTESFACLPMFTQAKERIDDDTGKLEVVRVFGQGMRCLSPYKPVMAEVRRIKAEPPPKSVSDRLRDLKQLRDENLITQEVYESRQRDILNTP